MEGPDEATVEFINNVKRDCQPFLRQIDNNIKQLGLWRGIPQRFGGRMKADTFIHKQGKMPIKDHPTVKPLQVIKDIVSVSKEDAVIFDPFLGSGTTMYACQDLRRSCIGIELEEKYCNLIKKRCFGRRFLTHSVSYDFIPYETFI